MQARAVWASALHRIIIIPLYQPSAECGQALVE
jgi:hypothetical protein